MKKLLIGLFLVSFLVAGAFAIQSVKASSSTLDIKVKKVLVDEDPAKDGGKKSKKANKAADAKATDAKSDVKSCKDASKCDPKATGDNNRSCCPKTANKSCCTKTDPNKK